MCVALKGRGGHSLAGKPDVFEHTLHFLTKWAAPMKGVPNVTGTQDTDSSSLKMGPTWDDSLRVIPQVGGSSFCSGFLCFVWVLDIELRTLHMLSVYSTTEPHPQPHGFNIFSVLWIRNRDTYFSKFVLNNNRNMEKVKRRGKYSAGPTFSPLPTACLPMFHFKKINWNWKCVLNMLETIGP